MLPRLLFFCLCVFDEYIASDSCAVLIDLMIRWWYIDLRIWVVVSLYK